MKNRIGLILLVLLCLGLAIVLVVGQRQVSDQRRQDGERIEALSNKWVKTSSDLEEQKQVAAMYEKDLESEKKAFSELTNSFSFVSSNLAQVNADLVKTETSMKEEMAKRDAKIGELETQNQALDKQALDLTTALTNLTGQIADTQKRLAASEGDKAFLQQELKRMMSEKAELERQFNDLTVLRAQVSKLKAELSIARRIEWIRQGLFASAEQKGATKLVHGLTVPQMTRAAAPRPAYDLNVEVSSDGSVRVIPPLTSRPAATNAAPAK